MLLSLRLSICPAEFCRKIVCVNLSRMDGNATLNFCVILVVDNMGRQTEIVIRI